MNYLVICSGNTCRSPMAAALLAARVGETHCVQSAGLFAEAGVPAAANAVAACAEVGLDIASHRAAQVTAAQLEAADRVLVMTESHRAALLAVGVPCERIIVLGVPDPFGGDIDIYRAARDAIDAALAEVLS